MSKYTLKVAEKFYDIETGELHEEGQEVEINDVDRVRNMLILGLAKVVKITPPKSIKKSGNKIIVYQKLLNWIGGIETFDYNLAKTFEDRNITFVFAEADFEQANRIGQFCEVRVDDGTESYTTDVLLLENYDAYTMIKGRVKARKIYQHIHADWANMKKMEIWQHFDWQPDEDVDKVLACSETAAKGLETAFEKPIKSTLAPNILCEPEESEFKLFLTLSRFTAEKGGEAIIKMVQEFNEAGKPFMWMITATELDFGIYKTLKSDPSILFITPSINNQELIKKADYLVQLSKNESFCYSVHEALQQGVPVIATDVPEMKKVIKQGENGYLVGQELEGLDVEAIFNKKPVFKPATYKVAPIWHKIIEGEL